MTDTTCILINVTEDGPPTLLGNVHDRLDEQAAQLRAETYILNTLAADGDPGMIYKFRVVGTPVAISKEDLAEWTR